jgi:FkbM family methyltransferase
MIAGTPLQKTFVSMLGALPAPLARRCGPGSRLARLFRPVVNRVVPTDFTIVSVRSGAARGARLAVNLRHEKYYWTGAYEPAVQGALRRFLAPGACFWDIGAHAGFFTILGARLVGESGRVHAFEPLPANRTRLKQAVDLNGFAHVVLHGYAVGAAAGTQRLHAHPASSMWSLVSRGGSAASVMTPVFTIDGLVAELGAPPDLIKVDVEDAEVDVLRGGLDFLEARRPLVIVELSDRVAEARALLPFYSFESLSKSHWLLTAR